MTLYQLSQDQQRLTDIILFFGGEITEEQSREIDALNIALENKIAACALVIKNMRAEASAIKEEEQALAARRKRLESKIDTLESNINAAIEHPDGYKITDPRFELKYSKSTKCVVTDLSKVPTEYINIKTESKPNLNAIKSALQVDPKSIKGAKLQQCYNLQIK